MAFDWKIWAKKVGKQLVYLLLAGAAVMYSDNPYFLAIQPALVGLENWLKHR